MSHLQNERMVDIADVAFAQVPDEEKRQHEAKPTQVGYWRGYKLRKFFVRTASITSVRELLEEWETKSFHGDQVAHREWRARPDRDVHQCVMLSTTRTGISR